MRIGKSEYQITECKWTNNLYLTKVELSRSVLWVITRQQWELQGCE